MDIRLAGAIVLSVCVICITALIARWLEGANMNEAAWITAFTQRGVDRNETERKEWIKANCELAAQVEELRAIVADLTCENDRNMDFLKAFNLSDIRLLRDNIDYVVKILNEIKAESKGIGGAK